MSDTIVVTVTSEGGAAGVVQTQAPVMTRQEMEQMKRDLQQVAQGQSPPNAEQLRTQIREQVRAQVEAARAQAQAAREAAAQAQGQPGVPAPPAPPDIPGIPEVTVTSRDGKVVKITKGPNGERVITESQTGAPFVFRPEVPREAVTISIAFFVMLAFIAVGLPLARAFARRMDRQATGAGGGFPTDVSDRIQRIEHSVEAIAIEVERISEGQRFTTKLLSELRPDAMLAAQSASATPERR
jgi:hypothetical protein